MKHPTPFFRRTLRLLEDARDQWQALCSRIKAPRDKATLARKLEVEHSVTQGLITQLIQTQNERTYYKTDLTRTQAQLATCARERDAFASDVAHRAHVEQELIRQCDQLRNDLMACRGQQELLLKSRTDFTQVADRVTHLTVPMRLPAWSNRRFGSRARSSIRLYPLKEPLLLCGGKRKSPHLKTLRMQIGMARY